MWLLTVERCILMLIVMMKDDDYDYVVDALTYDATRAVCGK